MDRRIPDPNDRAPRDADRTADRDEHEERQPRHRDEDEPNPPHTTTGKLTAPKFGSAGSGGAELEPAPGLKKN